MIIYHADKILPQSHQTYMDERLKFCRDDSRLLQIFPRRILKYFNPSRRTRKRCLPTQILQNETAQDKDQTNRTNRRLAVSERGRRMGLEP